MSAFCGLFPLDMKGEARQGKVEMDMDLQIEVVCNWDFEGSCKALRTGNISSSFSYFASMNNKKGKIWCV